MFERAPRVMALVTNLRERAGFASAVIRLVENWPRFLLDNRGLLRPGATYRLRSGPRISTQDRGDAGTIAEIFIGKEYGTVEGMSTIVDVGAHIGAFALYAAFTAGVNRVYSCEPTPGVFELLQKNVESNAMQDRIFPIRIAVAGKTANLPFYMAGMSTGFSLFPKSGGETGSVVEVEAVDLDDLFARLGITRCDLLKMDCEGAEFDALYAASEQTLARIERMRVEFHLLSPPRSEEDVKRLIAHLETNGFRVTHLRSDRAWGGLVWLERGAA